jgi:hypothetical protein
MGDMETLINRMRKAIGEAKEANLRALRQSSELADMKYSQGMLDMADDMESRLMHEYKKLNKEMIDDDE